MKKRLALLLAVIMVFSCVLVVTAAGPIDDTNSIAEEAIGTFTVINEDVITDIQEIDELVLPANTISPARGVELELPADSTVFVSENTASLKTADTASAITASSYDVGIMRAGPDYGNTSPNTALFFNTPTSAGTWTDYVRANGESRWYATQVPANSTLYVSLDQPKISGLDYDLHVWELSGSTIYYLSNNGFGMMAPGPQFLSEEFDIKNTTSTDKIYFIEVQSFSGFSNDSPFALGLQVISGTPSRYSVFAANQPALKTTFNSHLNAFNDSSWCLITNPRTNGIALTLDPKIIGPTYSVELFTLFLNPSTGKYYLQQLSPASDGIYYVGSGTLYIRVKSTNGLYNSQGYDLTLGVNNNGLMARYEYSTVRQSGSALHVAAYDYQTSRMVAGSGGLSIRGNVFDAQNQPLPDVHVWWEFTNLSYNDPALGTRSGVAASNADGYYNASSVLPTALGYNLYNSGYDFYYWDYATLTAEIGNVRILTAALMYTRNGAV